MKIELPNKRMVEINDELIKISNNVFNESLEKINKANSTALYVSYLVNGYMKCQKLLSELELINFEYLMALYNENKLIDNSKPDGGIDNV